MYDPYEIKNIENMEKTKLEERIKKELFNITMDDIPEFSLNGLKTFGKIVDIYDGDTCKIIINNNNSLMRFNCRLNFIDAPEMKPLKNKINREIEITNAIKTRDKLLQMTTNCNINTEDKLTKKEIQNLLRKNNKILTIKCYEFDKYGRLLVELYDKTDESINSILVKNGYAKLYDGGTKENFNY